MKVIILAAGQGTRLRPYTNNKPKSLVELWGKSLLERQITSLENAGVLKEDIVIVTGYEQQQICELGYPTVSNPHFATSNMLTSLFYAKALFSGEDDVLVTYGDVLYSEDLMDLVANNNDDILVPGNVNWLKLWQQRMDNPYDDVESFVYNSCNKLTGIGQKVKDDTEVMAQYMGVFKVRAQFCSHFTQAYDDFLRINDCSTINHLYITDFLDYLARNGNVSTGLFTGGWIEVDSADDLEFYRSKSPQEFGLL